METVAAYLVGAKFNGLTNSYMTPEQRAALDPNSKEYSDRIWGSKIQVMGWSFYAFILWAIKFCVAVFYARLTYVARSIFNSIFTIILIKNIRTGLAHMDIRIKIAYVSLAVTYLTVALTIILSCQPMRKFWQINPDPGSEFHYQSYLKKKRNLG